MILLARVDRIPAVGVAQRLINACRRKDLRFASVPELVEDAIFGGGTREAVKKAQGAVGLRDDGVVGPDTWGKLSEIAKFRIVHVVDRAIEHMLKNLGRGAVRKMAIEQVRVATREKPVDKACAFGDMLLAKCDREVELFRGIADNYRSLGDNPIEITSMTDPLSEIRRGIAERSRDGWQVVILRIVAHGGPGSQIIACSPFGSYRFSTDLITRDDDDSPSELAQTLVLERMMTSMARFGCLELHGCSIAKKQKPPKPGKPPRLTGAPYIQALANAVGRPATAAVSSQQASGGLRPSICFEGSTLTSYPGGSTAEQWFSNNS